MPGLLADETREHDVFVPVEMVVVAATDSLRTKWAEGRGPAAAAGHLEIEGHP